MKNILLLNTSIFVMFILGFISFLLGLHGNYLIAFAILALTAVLDYYDYFITKKPLKTTPLKWELKLITRFINFSFIPIIFSFFHLNLVKYSFLVYIPLILYLIATILNTAYNLKNPNYKEKIPFINKTGLVLVLFLGILNSSQDLWFLYLAVVLSLSYLILKDINQKL